MCRKHCHILDFKVFCTIVSKLCQRHYLLNKTKKQNDVQMLRRIAKGLWKHFLLQVNVFWQLWDHSFLHWICTEPSLMQMGFCLFFMLLVWYQVWFPPEVNPEQAILQGEIFPTNSLVSKLALGESFRIQMTQRVKQGDLPKLYFAVLTHSLSSNRRMHQFTSSHGTRSCLTCI